MKKAIILFAVLSVILSPAIALATDVGGIIDTDTTWDLAGSPYRIVSKVQVAENVILTIDPGVELLVFFTSHNI